MSNKLGLLILLIILIAGQESDAQRLGLLPYKTNLQELTHDSLRIVFPEGYEATAKRVASIMLNLASADPITRQGRYKPITVILQPYTNESRGSVNLAPYDSELMLQPEENPFKSGSLPWAELQALYQYRHVQQLNAVNTSISHLIKVVFGEKAYRGMFGLAVSNWLTEGDAITTETRWTPQGRGRLNQFLLPFREKNRKDEFWKYYVLRNGSFKQYVPDNFPLGYLMTNYGNHVFGEATWDTIFRLTPKMKPIYDPFSGVVKKFYGKSNRFLYQDAFNYYGDLQRQKEVPAVDYPKISISEKNQQDAFFDMSFPGVADDGTIYTSISSFDSIATIYSISTDGRRTKIASQGIQYSSYFDQRQHLLVWTEKRVDPRWLRRDKNVIVVYDILRKKKKDINPSKGYFMPSFDASANRIVALHTDPEGHYSLHLLDVAKGSVIQQLPNDENLYLGYPVFDEDNENIIASARNSEGKMCLIEQNIKTGIIKQITPYSYFVLGRHDQHGPWLFFTCGLEDLDQIYAFDRRQGYLYQVSKGNKAHYDPAWDPVEKNLVCSQYANNGRKLVRIPILLDKESLVDFDTHIKDAEEAPHHNLLKAKDPERPFTLKKYSPWKGAINYYGVGLVIDAPTTGIQLQSENILNSILLSTGYSYNTNNKAGGPYFDIRLGMWYPTLSFGYKNTTRRPTSIDSLQFRTILDEIYLGLSLPLYYSPGVFEQSIQFSSHVSTGKRKLRITYGEELESTSTFYYGKHSFVFKNSRKKAYRQPYSSWSQRLNISYAHGVRGSEISQWFASADFSLPGISASNYSLISSNMLLQGNGLTSIRLGSEFMGARGFHIQDGGKNYKLSLSYGFPVIYPDIGFGNILYVARIRLQPFFDMAYSDSFEAVSSNMSSTGAEILFDFYLGTFTIGFRYSRLLNGFNGNPNSYEIFIPSHRF